MSSPGIRATAMADVLARNVPGAHVTLAGPNVVTAVPKDPKALAAAIAKLLDDANFRAKCRANLAAARASLQWDVTLRPLIDFCGDDCSPVAPKWERLPELVQRVFTYLARRAIFQYSPPRD
jgi:glycosyltransferase involved in cell wall biosynthesis